MSGACAGEAVAHGNGGTGRLLSDFLLATRLATANQGGGFVNYSSSLRRKDNYGSTHGSYVLPIYNAEGVVTHFAGTSFSTAPAPPSSSICKAGRNYEIPVVVCLVASLVLCMSIMACGIVQYFAGNSVAYCSLQANMLDDVGNDACSYVDNSMPVSTMGQAVDPLPASMGTLSAQERRSERKIELWTRNQPPELV